MVTGLHNQLLANSEHDDMRLLYADEENLIYFNADKCRMSAFDYIDKENKGAYVLGELDPVDCVMLGNEIYFIESESGYLYKADNQRGKVEALFEAIPYSQDDDITICSKAIAKDKYILQWI